MDKWSREQIDNMLAMGNERANEFWEQNIPEDFPRPNDEGERRNFIKNKYVRRIWAPSKGPIPSVY
jgi:stromal membrane-associated protein